MSISGLRRKHKRELDKLTLTLHPFKTLKFFTLAILQHINRSVEYIFTHVILLLLLTAATMGVGVLLVTDDGPYRKHVEVLLEYLRFGLWWVALGVASSIGLGGDHCTKEEKPLGV